MFAAVVVPYCAHSGSAIDNLLSDLKRQQATIGSVPQAVPADPRLLDTFRQPEAPSSVPGQVVDQPEVRRSISTESPQSVPIEAYPWVVGLFNEGQGPADGYFCAGVIIGDTEVLTTAYCADAIAHMNVSVVVGTSDLRTAGDKQAIAKINSTKIHPRWNRETHENDAAILEIGPPSHKRPRPIGLSEEPALEYVGAIGQVVGWGVTNRTQPPNNTLQLIQTQVLSAAVCSGLGGFANEVPAGQFCAQSLLKDFDACYGFGGSPLILNDSLGHRFLAGILSWGSLCPPEGHKPSVYTDIQSLKEWLISEMLKRSQVQ